MDCCALIMAGGQGTRFWPESTSVKPKQFLSIVHGKSLLRQTLERLQGLIDRENRFVVSVEGQSRLLELESGPLLNKDNIFFEPEGRNTAPCIFLSILNLLAEGISEEAAVAILPSDHIILQDVHFRSCLKSAYQWAQREKKIVTLGIAPHFPHTGYGYIQIDDQVPLKDEGSVHQKFPVLRFVEKPNSEVARSYVKAGTYFWNAGMFVARISTLLEEFLTYLPAYFQVKDEILKALKEGDKKSLAKSYASLKAESMDYAIMEKSNRIGLIKANFDWNDLGSWDALEHVCEKEEGNVILNGEGKTYLKNARGNIVYSGNKQSVSLVDIENLVVVSNDKHILVLPKTSSQKVKDIVKVMDGKQL